jgi:8-oxo-dGTP pyrophosphatase MutT (NUDIX family)
MKLKDQLEQYIPFDEQEAKDKEYFLEWLNTFQDVLTRENVFGHFSSSAFVINKERSKALMVYHNIFDSWIYPGGHADGEENLIEVAIKEVEEETGVKVIRPIIDGIYAIQSSPIKGHFKRGTYIPSHIHLDVTFLFEADDNIPLIIKEDENRDVVWMAVEECIKNSNIDFMKPVYDKIVKRMKTIE